MYSLLDHEDGGNAFIPNTVKLLLNYAASHPRKKVGSFTVQSAVAQASNIQR